MKKRNLKKQICSANTNEKEGLLKIWQDLKEKHNALIKGENLRNRREKRRKEQERFFSRNHTNMRGTYLINRNQACTRQRKKFWRKIQKTYFDPNRHILLEHSNNLVWPAVPNVRFDIKKPTREETRRIVSKSKNKSIPGPIGIPFLLYKKCPKVLNWLYANLKQALKNFHISNQWMIADGVYIPKEKN